MGNFQIETYKWLYENFKGNPEIARQLQNNLMEVSKIENFAYPINAKYHFPKMGLDMTLLSRRISLDAFIEEAIGYVENLCEWVEEIKSKLSI